MVDSKHETGPQGGPSLKGRILFGSLLFFVLSLFWSSTVSGQACAGGCTLDGDMILNGSFADGCPGTNTPINGAIPGLHYVPCNAANWTNPLDYSEANAASIGGWNGGQWTGTDNTPGGGTNFMIVDGPTAGDQVVWSRSVTVTMGTRYLYQAFVCNLIPVGGTGNDPLFRIRVTDNTGTTVLASNLGNIVKGSGWQRLCGAYTAIASGNITLDILMVNNPNFQGNDGGIDDITFQPIHNNADFTYMQAACRSDFNFKAVDRADQLQIWDFGDGASLNGMDVAHTYTTPGDYLVTHTVVTGACTTSVSKIVKAESCCTCVTDPNAGSSLNKVGDGDFHVLQPCPRPPHELYSSDFLVAPCGVPQGPPSHGQYVETLTSLWKDANGNLIRSYCAVDDHSSAQGTAFLIVDGAIPSDNLPNSPEPRAWFQTGPTNSNEGYDVDPTKSYCFKASFFNPESKFPSKPSVKLVIKVGTQSFTVARLDFLPYNNECGWTTICGCWTPPQGVRKVTELDIVMEENTCNFANDIGIDDVIFEESQVSCDQSCGTSNQVDQTNSAQQGGDPTGGLSPVKTNIKPLNSGSNDINVHPIPVMQGHDLHVSYHSMDDRKVSIQVIGNDGKLQLQMNSQIKLGQNDILVKTESLKPGSYILRIESNDSIDTKTIIVQ